METIPNFSDRMACRCPVCGAMCEARPAFRQATRQEPMKFLGWQAYCFGECKTCLGGMGFTPTHVQETLAA